MSDNKKEQMRRVRDDVWHLTSSPLYSYRVQNHYYPVLGEGNHNAKIIFIGEAPGKTEAETGRPFCGAAGKLLDEMLISIGLERKEVYVTSILKDRPPNNRDPLPDEIDLYAPFLMRQINIIQPSIIATLGRFSMKFILESFNLSQKNESISSLHGKQMEIITEFGKKILFPLYHPAAVLYDRSKKEILFADFKKLQQLVESTP